LNDLDHLPTLGFAEPLLRALSHEGYATPTPIQAKAIPFLMEGHDLLGIAQTGTGKTAAFALPILHKLLASKTAPPGTARALILAPTRELAAQIGESFTAYARFCRLLGGGGVRRRRLWPADEGAARRRRCAGGHARPADRPSRQRQRRV
jgi:ATP-dependent RNA helicase RhlE